MDRIALHGMGVSAARSGSGDGQHCQRLRRAGLTTLLILLGAAVFASDPAMAQYNGGGTYGRSVIVNPEVLNNLGAGGGVNSLPYRPGHQQIYNPTVPYTPYNQSPQGGFPVARPGTLLYPPLQRPQSQVLNQGRPAYQNYQSQYQNPYAAAPSTQGYLPQQTATGQPRSQLLVPAPEPSSASSVASTLSQPTAQASQPEPAAVVPLVPAAPVPVPTAAPEPPSVEETTLAAVPEAPAPSVPAEVEQVETLIAQPETVPALPAVVVAPPSEPAEVVTATVNPPAEPSEEELPPPPPEPEAAAIPAVESTEPAAQTATLAPAVDQELAARVLFGAGSADLSTDGKSELESLAKSLNADESLRVQLLAFASGDGDAANAARRLSLSRALVVRGFLIDQGIPSTRMQVRALGNKYESGPPDRVDIRPQSS